MCNVVVMYYSLFWITSQLILPLQLILQLSSLILFCFRHVRFHCTESFSTLHWSALQPTSVCEYSINLKQANTSWLKNKYLFSINLVYFQFCAVNGYIRHISIVLLIEHWIVHLLDYQLSTSLLVLLSFLIGYVIMLALDEICTHLQYCYTR